MSKHGVHDEEFIGGSRRRPLIHMQVKEWILQQLDSGQLVPGSQLPAERELARKLGVSLVTIRTALAELQWEGILGRQQGRGTFVLSHGVSLSSRLEDLAPLPELIRDSGYQPQMTLLKIQEEACSPSRASWFEIDPGIPLLKVQRVYLADQKPAVFVIDRIPVRLLRNKPSLETFDGDMLHFLEKESHYSVDHVFASIKAVAAQMEEVSALRISPGSPVLMIEQQGYSAEENPVLLTQGFNLSDLILYTVVRKRRRMVDD